MSMAYVDHRSGNDVSARQEPPLPSEPVNFAESGYLGSPTARVGMLVFSDFECPYCRRFATDALPRLIEQYVTPGRVFLVYKHFPLAIHSSAEEAARLAECARGQNNFWGMHDALFRMSPLRRHLLDTEIEELHLNPSLFRVCVGTARTAAAVHSDFALGQSLGVEGTPTLFFGVRSTNNSLKVRSALVGARPLAAFQVVVDRLLAER